MNASVYCTTKTAAQAETIIDALKRASFSNTHFSVLLPDQRATLDFAHEPNPKAPDGEATGGVAGLGVGAAVGWLAGIGALAIPGVGPLIAAGPIMAALGGAAVGTATGGVIGGLVGMGIPEFEAKRYDAKIREGNVLISVHTEDGEQRDVAREIFKRNDAEDISTGSEASAKSA
jgi:hypothetical protein